jgi:hypothetical protein
VSAVGGRCPLMLRTACSVVRRTSRVGVRQRDRERGLRVVHGHGPPGVSAAERDLLPGDHDQSGVAGAALDVDHLGRRPRRRPGLAGAADVWQVRGGQRVESGAEQLAGAQFEEHQHVGLDADPDLPAGEDPTLTGRIR